MTARQADRTPQPWAAPFERLLATRVALNWEVALYLVVFAAAFGLRFWDLGGRALHHDESIHAQWSWSLIQGNYHHSPIFHGPFYYHIQGLVFLLFGASDYTSRVSAAIFGTALVALPLLLRRRLGPVGTLAAVALVAFSPTLVYYSRFFREDIYMAVFTMLGVVGLWRYMDDGRARWLFVFAAGFVGSVLVKEGAFLTAAVFLLYLDLYLAAELARRTVGARKNDSARNRAVLTLGLAPWAWAIAALWPFLGALRKRMDWEELPRSGDLLVLLGTLTLPLLTPLSRIYLLEPLGIVEKDRLNWEKKFQGGVIPTRDAVALGGLFAVTVSMAAFAGLQWKPKVWAIAFFVGGLVYLTLMTSFWTNMNGLVSGPWGSLDYWAGQQDQTRGDQPWFYYYMVMAMYEFLPIALALGAIWWAVARGDAFSRFLVFWLAGIWLILSWTSEKMPWNNVHIALPTCLLAAWAVQRAWTAWSPRPPLRRTLVTLGSVAAVAAGSLAAIAFLPGGSTYAVVRLAIAVAAIGLILYAAWPFGRKAAATVLVVAVVGAFSFFSFRTMLMASFERGDDPKDLLIYTQSSGDLARIARQIDELAAATGKGYALPIAVDSTDSFAWPWAWYLRDYKAVSYVDFTNGAPAGDFAVLLVNSSNVSKVNDQLISGTDARYGSPRKYPHRWWFDETYKEALNVGEGACLTKTGNCGPFRPATWQAIAEGVTSGGWLTTWASYWRDHDPHRTNGSTDAYAYFPANYDIAKAALSAKPIEPPKPGFDKAGRPSFGGVGTQPGQFFQPTDVEQDSEGNLYVIDSKTKKLQKFDPAGNVIASVDVRNNPSDAADGSEPWGLAVQPGTGRVVVADTFGWKIRVFDRDLKPILAFGNPPDTTKAPGPFDLFGPRDAIIDASGNIWVTDTGNDRIQVYSANGQFVRTVGGSGSGPSNFDEPVGLSQGPDGSIFVADMFNRRVVVLTADGSSKGQFTVDGWGGQEVFDKPYLRALADGRVAVSLPSLNEVRIYSSDGKVAGSLKAPDDPLNRPYGILQTADGKLWVAEGGSGRLRLFALP
ncbi:MAG: flippase activity-associated protein Agl23 [Tepidiformaceae bacterium]